jgi:mono/diheme cytochrome c family protein
MRDVTAVLAPASMSCGTMSRETNRTRIRTASQSPERSAHRGPTTRTAGVSMHRIGTWAHATLFALALCASPAATRDATARGRRSTLRDDGLARSTSRSDGGAANAQSSAPARGDATRGRAAFDGICGRCHPHGNADVGPRLIGLNWSESRVRDQVRHGRRTMRPITTTRLPDDRLDDVIAYLRTIHTVQ